MKGGPVDIEASGGGGGGGVGAGQLYPNMMENPQFRWAFIRKVYVIIAMQLLLTVVVAAIVIFIKPLATFMVSRPAGLAVYISIILSTFLGEVFENSSCTVIYSLYFSGNCFLGLGYIG